MQRFSKSNSIVFSLKPSIFNRNFVLLKNQYFYWFFSIEDALGWRVLEHGGHPFAGVQGMLCAKQKHGKVWVKFGEPEPSRICLSKEEIGVARFLWTIVRQQDPIYLVEAWPSLRGSCWCICWKRPLRLWRVVSLPWRDFGSREHLVVQCAAHGQRSSWLVSHWREGPARGDCSLRSPGSVGVIGMPAATLEYPQCYPVGVFATMVRQYGCGGFLPQGAVIEAAAGWRPTIHCPIRSKTPPERVALKQLPALGLVALSCIQLHVVPRCIGVWHEGALLQLLRLQHPPMGGKHASKKDVLSGEGIGLEWLTAKSTHKPKNPPLSTQASCC